MAKFISLGVLALAFSASSLSETTTNASADNRPTYQLSLGDSLSIGNQPNASDLQRPVPFIGCHRSFTYTTWRSGI